MITVSTSRIGNPPPLLETRSIFHGRKSKQKQHPKLASCFEKIRVSLVPPLSSFLHLTLPFELAFEVSTRLYNCYLFLYFHHRSFILTWTILLKPLCEYHQCVFFPWLFLMHTNSPNFQLLNTRQQRTGPNPWPSWISQLHGVSSGLQRTVLWVLWFQFESSGPFFFWKAGMDFRVGCGLEGGFLMGIDFHGRTW